MLSSLNQARFWAARLGTLLDALNLKGHSNNLGTPPKGGPYTVFSPQHLSCEDGNGPPPPPQTAQSGKKVY